MIPDYFRRVRMETYRIAVGPVETSLPPRHRVYVDDYLVLDTEDFVYALQAYINRIDQLRPTPADEVPP